MSSNKKDLTRIEDLGEFVHELDNTEDFSSESDFSSEELPDLPSADEEESSFTSDFSTSDDLSFGSSEESSAEEETTFGETDFGSGDFGSDDSTTDFSPETTSFEEKTEEELPTGDFGSSDFNLDLHTEEKIEEPSEPLFETKAEPALETTSAWEETPLESITPGPVYTPSETYRVPENFEDLKKFSENSSFGTQGVEGNPSFSVLVKNVRYIEDVNDIVTLLKELNLLTDPEDQVKGRLMRGMLLIPRVSEYAAIFLAHKLRRFDIDIQVGLSDEIHPPKHQETPETGIVSKHNLYQNQNHHFHFDDPKLELSQIIVAATPALEGYQVLRYLGVASEHKMLDSHIVEDENSNEIPHHYQELAQKLKAHALKAHSNAVVGLNYQLTPIPSEFGMGGHKYRLTCTGNLVWVNKL